MRLQQLLSAAVLQALANHVCFTHAFTIIQWSPSRGRALPHLFQPREQVAIKSGKRRSEFNEESSFPRGSGLACMQTLPAGGAEGIIASLVGRDEEGRSGKGAEDMIGVFYNRVGTINRDLSVLMANVLAEERLKERMVRKKRKRKRRAHTSPLGAPAAPDVLESSGDGGCNAVVSPEHIAEKPQHQSSGEEQMEEEDEGDEEDEEGLVILDAFAASGVRALRYLTEVPGVARVVANDHDTAAVELIRRAAKMCGAGEELEAHHGDALDTMYAARAGGLGTYDLIDIDPFGCAAGFLDASVQAVKDGGLLCITSTDMPVLSGAQPAVAFARYGSVPTRSGYHHEMSLRILLHATSAAAGRHRRSIKPVLSVAIDHYVRVFVRVFRSPKAALAATRRNVSYVLQSETCPSFFLLPVLPQQSSRGKSKGSKPTPHSTNKLDLGVATDAGGVAAAEDGSTYAAGEEKGAGSGRKSGLGESSASAGAALGLGGVCPETGGALKMGGPMWSGPLHDEEWVARAIAFYDLTRESAAGAVPVEKEKGGVPFRSSLSTSLPVSCTSDGDGKQKEEGTRDRNGAVELTTSALNSPPSARFTAGARMKSLLTAASRELSDVPLFYNLRDMFATLGLARNPRREQVMGALQAAGYRASGMHKEPLAIKTNAPDAAVWDILRCWVRENPQPPPRRAAGLAILSRSPQLIDVVDFSVGQAGFVNEGGHVERESGNFLHARNPERSWGPLGRRKVVAGAGVTGSIMDGDEEETD